jgi:CxxC motif-containing protein (DUF1111 family)
MRGAALGTIFAIAMAAVRAADAPEQEFGRTAFLNSRDPPAYRLLAGADRDRFELGHAIFNTHFVEAGMPRATRRDGLGPLFNASACDACHNEGAHGRGPIGDGVLPSSLVVELSSPDSSLAAPKGDPRYGRTFNVVALDGFLAEGEASVSYTEHRGRYADGETFSLRVPAYRLTKLQFGALAKDTVVQPRLAPALFGSGLLERVAGAEQGRFGWQNTAASLSDQTAQALSRDMGLTSPQIDHDDCTAEEKLCRAAPNGGTPEIDQEYFQALVAFQENLAVPEHSGPPEERGEMIFDRLGCPACHVASHHVSVDQLGTRTIRPYTDLKRHDLGTELADHAVNGRTIASRFRTAPLWGLGYRIEREQYPTFLHDGRARSPAEAILWHGGEAAPSRELFERLPGADRQLLVKWLGAL